MSKEHIQNRLKLFIAILNRRSRMEMVTKTINDATINEVIKNYKTQLTPENHVFLRDLRVSIGDRLQGHVKNAKVSIYLEGVSANPVKITAGKGKHELVIQLGVDKKPQYSFHKAEETFWEKIKDTAKVLATYVLDSIRASIKEKIRALQDTGKRAIEYKK